MTVETLTTSGTWTCPAGISSVQVECVGGGGGGDSAGNLGGGGGAYAKDAAVSVTPGTNYAYVVGAGGTAGSGNGGASSFGATLVVAAGGKSGTSGGAGGATANCTGTTKTAGSAGTDTHGGAGASPLGGAGGTSAAGTAPGGGGGPFDGTSTYAGARGEVVLTYVPAVTITLGLPAETDSALTSVPIVATVTAIGLPVETDTAFALTLAGTVVHLGIAEEGDSALAASIAYGYKVSLGIAAETDSASSITRSGKIAFTPPVVQEGLPTDDILFCRYSLSVGQSVLRIDGTWKLVPYPWLGEIADLVEGVDWFQGGRTYLVDDFVVAEMQADGVPVA